MDPAQQILIDSWRYWPHLYAVRASGGKWAPYPYLVKISDAITSAIVRGNGRIIVNLPPRHGKSEFISRWTPTWFLDLFPYNRVILTTYEADFAAHWGRLVRNELMGNPLCNTKLTEDSQAAYRWETREGGGMVTAGVGGPITGRGGDLIIIDDPVKNQEEAESETIQQRNIDWFQSTLYTRAEPGATIILLMTRWHDKDLTGWILRNHPDKWQLFRFPALADRDDALGREVGEPLCPARFDAAALAEIRVAVGPRHWAGLYQQEPVDPETALFKRHWIQYFDDWPSGPFRSYLTIDLAYSTKKSADFVVILHSKVDAQKRLYVADYVRGHLAVGDMINAVFNMVEQIPTLDCVGLEIPPGETENNSAIVLLFKEEMRRRGRFFTLKPIRPVRDKVSRASVLAPLFSNGMVYIRRTQTELEDELLRFPAGEHDDLVDALAYVPHIWAAPRRKAPPQPEPADAAIGY